MRPGGSLKCRLLCQECRVLNGLRVPKELRDESEFALVCGHLRTLALLPKINPRHIGIEDLATLEGHRLFPRVEMGVSVA